MNILNFILGLTAGIIIGWFVACYCMTRLFANIMHKLDEDQFNFFDNLIRDKILHTRSGTNG